MKVWEVKSDVENFASICLTGCAESLLDLYENWPYFEGQKFGDTWPKFQAQLIIPNAAGNFERAVGNFVYMDPGILVCDNFSLIKLRKLLLNEVENLPIGVEGLNMKILNVINIIDCLDKTKSEVVYFKNSHKVMRIKKYSFNTSLLENVALFKIPQLVDGYIFATDAFRERVLEDKLTGLKFILVHSDA